ncbi:MAG: amino acid permease [Spirochaetota bacterium]|nr:MAG: amino acid permease [Spirochaetota bacterium]
MAIKLKKELGTLEVFSISSGAMVSSGLFVLPAVVYLKSGPSIILAYVLASILIIPAMLSKAELATAMPKSGGTYFFTHRSLGPLFGTFAGLASWFSLSLKSTFALLGIGIFLEPLLPAFTPHMGKFIALGFTVLFTILNILSVKESGVLQDILLLSLIGILLFYIFTGMNHIDIAHYVPFKTSGWKMVYTVTGMIFVSFGGLTKVAAIAEEIRNPSVTIPRGMFSSFSVVTLLYALTIFVTVGLLDKTDFQHTLTPISLGASKHLGTPGYMILLAAGMLAFITTANAGLLAASRNPMAMAKDHLLPHFFSRVSVKLKTPVVSILITSLFMILVITFLDLVSLVKVASTMMLLLFSLVNISVILMRESKIVSYKPTFKSPFYPYLQIAGIAIYLSLIVEMGLLPLIMTVGFFLISLLWYFAYSKSRNLRQSALIHIVERVTSREIRSTTLTNELREILQERDEIVEDRFDRIIKNATIFDIKDKIDHKALFRILSDSLSEKFQIPSDTLYDLLEQREKDSTTAIHEGLAIPHIIVEGKSNFDIILVRSKEGIDFGYTVPPVHIVFALAGTRDERNFHLQALMAIAQIVQNKDFIDSWLKTGDIEDLRNLILLAQRVRKGEV